MLTGKILQPSDWPLLFQAILDAPIVDEGVLTIVSDEVSGSIGVKTGRWIIGAQTSSGLRGAAAVRQLITLPAASYGYLDADKVKVRAAINQNLNVDIGALLSDHQPEFDSPQPDVQPILKPGEKQTQNVPKRSAVEVATAELRKTFQTLKPVSAFYQTQVPPAPYGGAPQQVLGAWGSSPSSGSEPSPWDAIEPAAAPQPQYEPDPQSISSAFQQADNFGGQPSFSAHEQQQAFAAFNQAPSSFSQAPPDFAQAPPEFGQAPPGFGQPPPGFGQPPPGFGQAPPAVPGFSDFQNQASPPSAVPPQQAPTSVPSQQVPTSVPSQQAPAAVPPQQAPAPSNPSPLSQFPGGIQPAARSGPHMLQRPSQQPLAPLPFQSAGHAQSAGMPNISFDSPEPEATPSFPAVGAESSPSSGYESASPAVTGALQSLGSEPAPPAAQPEVAAHFPPAPGSPRQSGSFRPAPQATVPAEQNAAFPSSDVNSDASASTPPADLVQPSVAAAPPFVDPQSLQPAHIPAPPLDRKSVQTPSPVGQTPLQNVAPQAGGTHLTPGAQSTPERQPRPGIAGQGATAQSASGQAPPVPPAGASSARLPIIQMQQKGQAQNPQGLPSVKSPPSVKMPVVKPGAAAPNAARTGQNPPIRQPGMMPGQGGMSQGQPAQAGGMTQAPNAVTPGAAPNVVSSGAAPNAVTSGAVPNMVPQQMGGMPPQPGSPTGPQAQGGFVAPQPAPAPSPNPRKTGTFAKLTNQIFRGGALEEPLDPGFEYDPTINSTQARKRINPLDKLILGAAQTALKLTALPTAEPSAPSPAVAQANQNANPWGDFDSPAQSGPSANALGGSAFSQAMQSKSGGAGQPGGAFQGAPQAPPLPAGGAAGQYQPQGFVPQSSAQGETATPFQQAGASLGQPGVAPPLQPGAAPTNQAGTASQFQQGGINPGSPGAAPNAPNNQPQQPFSNQRQSDLPNSQQPPAPLSDAQRQFRANVTGEYALLGQEKRPEGEDPFVHPREERRATGQHIPPAGVEERRRDNSPPGAIELKLEPDPRLQRRDQSWQGNPNPANPIAPPGVNQPGAWGDAQQSWDASSQMQPEGMHAQPMGPQSSSRFPTIKPDGAFAPPSGRSSGGNVPPQGQQPFGQPGQHQPGQFGQQQFGQPGGPQQGAPGFGQDLPGQAFGQQPSPFGQRAGGMQAPANFPNLDQWAPDEEEFQPPLDPATARNTLDHVRATAWRMASRIAYETKTRIEEANSPHAQTARLRAAESDTEEETEKMRRKLWPPDGATIAFVVIGLIGISVVVCGVLLAMQQASDTTFIDNGKKALAENRDQQAVEQFTLALDKSPDKPEVIELRAGAYEKLKDYEHGAADYAHLYQLKPTNKDAGRKAALFLFKQGKFDDAASLCKQILTTTPDDESVKALLAMSDSRAGRYSEATAVTVDPELVPAYMSSDFFGALGFAYFNLNDLQKAIEQYNKGLETDAKNDKLLVERAAVYLKAKDYKHAQADYKALVAVAPSRPGILADYANASMLAGDAQTAADYYEKALKFNPSNELLLKLAQAELAAGRPGRAVGYCDSIIKLNPRAADAIKLRQEAMAKAKSEKAIVTAVITFDPVAQLVGRRPTVQAASEDPLTREAFLSLQAKQWQHAVDILPTVFKRSPSDWAARRYYAAACMELGRDADAYNTFNIMAQSHALLPTDEVPYAEAARNAGQLDRAIDIYINALKRDPNYFQARVELIKVCIAKGYNDKAAQLAAEGIQLSPQNKDEFQHALMGARR